MEKEVWFSPKVKFLFKHKRFKVLYGGRASGKSWAMARALLILSSQKKLRILCAREIMKSIKKSVHALLADQIVALGLEDQFLIQQAEIKNLKTGSIFSFDGLATNTVASIKSYESVDICWVEEGQTVSEKSWEILLPTIRTTGSEIWICFNPELETDPTYKRFVVNKELFGKDIISVLINYTDNEFFSEESRIQMEYDKARNDGSYEHIWLGECIKKSQAAVFDRYEVRGFEPEKDWSGPYWGLDFGHSEDPTVLLKSYIWENELYIEKECFLYHCELDMLPAKFDGMDSTSSKYLIRADCSRPETINYLKRNGYNRVSSCKKWKGCVEDGIDYIKNFNRVYIHPDCTHILEEFNKYSYKIDKLSNDVLPEVVDKYNHGIDALRYSLEPMILGFKPAIRDREDAPELDTLGRPMQANNRFIGAYSWQT